MNGLQASEGHMSRAYRIAIFVPAIVTLMNLVFAAAALAGPCPGGFPGCISE